MNKPMPENQGPRRAFGVTWARQLALFALLFILVPLAAFAASGDRSQDNVWTDLGDAQQVSLSASNRETMPNAYHVFSLDSDALDMILRSAPHEKDVTVKDGSVLHFPMPDGSYARFSVVESPILGPEAQAQIPDMRTYLAQGLDDPSAVLRFDVGYWGFRAYGRTSQGTLWIDPWELGDRNNYLSAWKHDFTGPMDEFECGVSEEAALPAGGDKSVPYSGDTLHTYRLVPTLTGEYVTYFGGINPALSAATTTFNRVNSIYEVDTAIRFNIVAWVAYDNPATDPFPNGSVVTSSLLNQNQAVVTGFYPPENWDIGHILTQGGGGGLAQLGVACWDPYKARGGTGRVTPAGDPFDVDYVAHEVGHQMGANHTFNGSTGACGGNNRNASTAFEPGSGSTIMAYAGICGAEDVQANSDPYFHVASLEEIINFRNSTSCQTVTGTGNTPPVADAGNDWTIPRDTPFYVTGGAYDADGDAVTYCWEQFDLGAASPPTDAYGPLFRSLNPTSASFRYFPDFTQAVTGGSDPWEVSPWVDRSLTLRLTVRDNRPGGGGTDDDELELTVAGAPFEVIYPNGGEVFTAGQPVTVTWDVGGSTEEYVRIFLLTDTFTFLNGFTANDGSETIEMPCGMTYTDCRVWIEGLTEAVGVRYFDTSDLGFTLNDGTPEFQPYVIGGWGDSELVSMEPEFSDANGPLPTVLDGDANSYFAYAFANFGTSSGCGGLNTILGVDETLVWDVELNVPALNYGRYWNFSSHVSGGRHTLWQHLDPDNTIPETDDTNNSHARQWVWGPQELAPDSQQLRAHPPERFAGTEHLPDGAPVLANLDGIRLPAAASGWWRGAAISNPDPGHDFDLLLYSPSSGVENGFDNGYLASSAIGGPNTDAVISNRNTTSNDPYDVGILNWNGADSDYRLEYREASDPLLIGDETAGTVAENQVLVMAELQIIEDQTGVITLELTSGAEQNVMLAVFDPTFTEGSIYSATYNGLTNGDGRTFIELNAPVNGYYGVAIYRNAYEGTEAFDYTLKLWPPSPDLASVAMPGSHGPLVPRNSDDIEPGNPVPAPVLLDGDLNTTRLYFQLANLGSASTQEFNMAFVQDGVTIFDPVWPFGDLPADPNLIYGEYAHTFTIPGGRHTSGIMLDSHHTNVEIFEDNNHHAEQWVWNPSQVVPEGTVFRNQPPVRDGGWDLVDESVVLFDNVDGMRSQTFEQGPGAGDGYLGAVAIMPTGDGDYDLRLHAPSGGASEGFDTILEESNLGGPFTDFILIDFDGVHSFNQNWDAGVVREYGEVGYALQSTRSLFLNDAGMVFPFTSGPYSIASGELISLTEFTTNGQEGDVSFNLDINHLSGSADFGVMVYGRNDPSGFYKKFDYLAFHEAGGPGQDKTLELMLPANAYYGVVVYKMDHEDLDQDLEYEVGFRQGVSSTPESQNLPTLTQIESVYPNPFNPQTTVLLAMHQAGHASVNIYDVQGRLVRTLVEGEMAAGRHELRWTGMDNTGRTVPSGVYFVRAVHPNGVDQQRMSLVK